MLPFSIRGGRRTLEVFSVGHSGTIIAIHTTMPIGDLLSRRKKKGFGKYVRTSFLLLCYHSGFFDAFLRRGEVIYVYSRVGFPYWELGLGR